LLAGLSSGGWDDVDDGMMETERGIKVGVRGWVVVGFTLLWLLCS
jgi:hypothetical protein